MYLSSDISFHIISLGCSKNLVESEKINGQMLSCGYNPAATSDEADIIIINTCGFVEEAKKESIDLILESVNLDDLSSEKGYGEPFLKSGNVDTPEFSRKVVAVGCLSQRYYDEIKSDIPEIDFIYRLTDENFVRLLSSEFNIRLVKDIRGDRKPFVDKLPYSYIKISEGCSNNCSYCAIPLIKGKLFSYPIDSIIEDSKKAVQNGAKELVIIAQDIASYVYRHYRLPDIVNVLSDIDGVEWIRLLYCHPDNLDDGIIKLLENNERVVKYIDIPFQHVNRDILESMGRKGDSDSYSRLIIELRDRIPDIKIRSTFMVGYPGETDNDFIELLKFVLKMRLDRIGCFMYSREEDTRAAMFRDHVSEKVKRNRYNRLMMTQKNVSKEEIKKMIGREVEVLIEKKIDDKTWIGRTQYDAPEVDGVFYLTGRDVALNKIIKANVTSTTEYDLIGELL